MLDYIESIPPGAKVIHLDASSLKYLACDQRYVFSVVDGLRTTTPSDILDCGSALHKFAELYASGVDYIDALSTAIAAYPRADKQAMMKICPGREAIRIPPALLLGGKMAVEQFFAFPWLAGTYNGTTYAVVICGTIDHLALDNQTLRIIDYKSTRKWKVEDIEKKYAYEVQLRFYPWALRKFGARILPLEVHNLATAGRMTAQVCAIQISGNNPRWVMLSPQSMTEKQYADFDAEMRIAAERVVALHRDQPARNGMLSNLCEWCDYVGICHAQTDSRADLVRAENFTIRHYNPANHGKTNNTKQNESHTTTT